MPYKDQEKNKLYQKKYQKKWYEKNKKIHLANVRRNKIAYVQKSKDFVNQYKSEKGCRYCSEKDFSCLDFHHSVDNKETDVSFAVKEGYSIDRIKREIEKCFVICSNCHRKLHAGRFLEKQNG